jgi:hypothetical protein
LNSGLATEEAKVRLRQAFVRKAFPQAPLFAFEYDEADIDWATGSVKIPRKKDRFCPTFLREDFNAHFFEDRVASTPSADPDQRAQGAWSSSVGRRHLGRQGGAGRRGNVFASPIKRLDHG